MKHQLFILVRLSLLVAILSLPALAMASPSYNPIGVQNDVPVSRVVKGGWRVHYKGLYSEIVPSAADLFDGVCDQIMLAAKRVNSSSFEILATIDKDSFVALQTSQNQTFVYNGAQWYKNDFSLGFASLDSNIFQSSADTNGLQDRGRLSWHTMRIIGRDTLQINGGWRAGNNTRLNKSVLWERYVLTAPKDGSKESKECLLLG